MRCLPSENFLSVGHITPAVRVIVAAAGEQGAQAGDQLSAAGYLVERVQTFAEARVRAATAPVVVVGELADTGADALRAAVRDGGGTTPLVHLGPADGYTVTVSGPSDPDLAAAVALARHVGTYHDAIDSLFEECRARATGDTDALTEDTAVDRSLVAARRHADESLARTRSTADGIPYDHLFES